MVNINKNKPSLNVAVIGPVYPYRGGISHSNTQLCSNVSKNHNLVAYSFKMMFPKFLYPGKQQKYEENRRLDFNVKHILNSLNPFNWLNVFMKLRKQNPDVVIFQWWTIFMFPMYITLALMLRLFTKAKICIWCQNVMDHERRFITVFLTKLFYRIGDYFIVMANQEKKELLNLLPNAKVEVIFEPTYEQHFSIPLGLTKEKAKSDLGLDKKVILFFGFVRAYKGLKYLLKAMPKILDNVDVQLLVVGEFWNDKKDYLKLITDFNITDNVKIVDKFVPDDKVAPYFIASDVFVLPYTSATQSGIIQVALGFDKPVIVTDVGGLTDLVENEKNGLVVPNKDIDKLADAVVTFFKDKKETKFAEGARKVKESLRWDKEKEERLFKYV